MYKYAFLIHHDDHHDFLEALQGLGVAHIATSKPGHSAAAQSLMDRMRRYHQLYLLLAQRNQSEVPDDSNLLAAKMATDVESRQELSYALEQAIQQTQSQLALFDPWRKVPLDVFHTLKEHGVFSHFFQCVPSAFRKEWENDNLLEVYYQSGDMIRFVCLSDSAVSPALEADRLYPPDGSYQHLEEKLHSLTVQKSENENALDQLASKKYILSKAIDALKEKVEWQETCYQTQQDETGCLLTLEAWVPYDKAADLDTMTAGKDILSVRMDVVPDDDIPVLLKNNGFARLFQPIGKLFALPNAQELDLTAFFAPFFALFFGLCLGDVGYGAILFLAVTAFRFTEKGKAMKDALVLIQWLSLATIFIGIITGTIFGAPLGEIGFFSRWNAMFLGPDQMFRIALWVGLFQIASGMFIRIFNRARQFGWIYGLSSIGWLLGLIGSVMLWNEWLPGTNLWITLAGVALILLFSEPKGNIFMRVGLGLWELYGASGLVGDMLSYIRLFALGLSSSILGLVINDISMSVLGDGSIMGWIFCILILAVGHGMNFFLATLSAFVHPMRLTFVEFYKNAGFSGGGRPYQPFSKTINSEI